MVRNMGSGMWKKGGRELLKSRKRVSREDRMRNENRKTVVSVKKRGSF